MQSRLRHHAHGLAQAYDQRLAGLVDREQRPIGDDQRHDDDGGDNAANEIESHRAAPVCGGAGGCGRRESWSSGRYGTTPAPESMMILSVPPNSRSMVSR